VAVVLRSACTPAAVTSSQPHYSVGGQHGCTNVIDIYRLDMAPPLCVWRGEGTELYRGERSASSAATSVPANFLEPPCSAPSASGGTTDGRAFGARRRLWWCCLAACEEGSAGGRGGLRRSRCSLKCVRHARSSGLLSAR